MEQKAGKTGEGAVASFAFDRARLERFRSRFPRARWSDDEKKWFVPGKTAEQRLARWLDHEADLEDRHGEAKGRDAFDFDPIESPYLEAGEALIIRTPFSRTVVNELRQVPFAHWDDEDRAWKMPYSSYDALRKRWPDIEAAARRNEPEAKRARAEASRGTEADRLARERATERQRRRHPLDMDDLPPLEQPVSTLAYGIVVFTALTGELVDPELMRRFYSSLAAEDSDHIWGEWRPPTLVELVETWPARQPPGEDDRRSGWWHPTKQELVAARKQAKAREKRRSGGV